MHWNKLTSHDKTIYMERFEKNKATKTNRNEIF